MQYQITDQSTATTEVAGEDIVSLINFLCDTDYLSYPPVKKVLNVNVGYEELVAMIINADGTWQFDDTNLTDLPRGKGSLVEGQESYTFASEYLQIEAIDILNLDALYSRIKPFDPKEHTRSPDEMFGVDSSGDPKTGFPEFYDIKGDSIRLYPAPTADLVTLADGIRVSFKRTIDLFVVGDTTQVPGLPSTHHSMLAYMASVPYCMKNHPQRVGLYEKKVDEMKRTLIKHYTHREKNKRKVLTTKGIIYR